jgi:chromosome partitioning protein
MYPAGPVAGTADRGRRRQLLGIAVRTIAVVNRKGGSGKTTTAVSLAAALAERGLPTLLIDLDPQGSASAWLTNAHDRRGLLRAFADAAADGMRVARTTADGLDIVRSTPSLLAAEQSLRGQASLSVVRAVHGLSSDWAFVIIDCPPSLSYLSVGALMAVGEVIIPVEAHAIALPGVAAVVREISRIQSTFNPGLRNPLIVACRVNRTLHARRVVDELQRTYGWRLARTTIRESVRLAEAEDARLPITAYAPDSGASFDYRLLADELIARGEIMNAVPRHVSRWRRLFTRSTHVAAAIHRPG